MNERIKNITFQGSNDLENWTTLATITQSAKDEWFEIPVDNTECFRYFRVNCPSGSLSLIHI